MKREAKQQKAEPKAQRKGDAEPESRITPNEVVTGSVADPAKLLQGAHHPTGRVFRQGAIQLLSQMIGNRATVEHGQDGRIFRQDEETGEAGEAEVDPEQQALQDFLDRGMMPGEEGEDVIGAGGRGGFNAKFDPDNCQLIATVNVGINFHHGLNVDPATGLVTANASGLEAGDASELATLQTAAANVMAQIPDIPERVNHVNTEWRWSAAEENPWMEQYRQAVTDAWSGQHNFQSRRWAELLSSVNVIVNVHKGAQEGDHCAARIIKSPPGGFGSAYVSYGAADNARDQGLLMSSSGVGPNATNFLRYSLQFENNSADLNTAVGTVHGTDAGPDYLDKFIADFEAANPAAGVPIQVIGRASSTGSEAYNRALSERRAAAVTTYLRSNGLVGSIDRVTDVGEGETGATEDATWRRVDIVVGSGEAQNTAAHEFGHMIGLGDEYSSPAAGFYPGAGTPVAVGDPAAHDALAQAMGGGVTGAVAENTDNIMSVGNTVQPQHYATFHKAIEAVTGESWQYGG
jgi:outer membrane protein OmpA-like peptidoglycan-associated protein